MASDRDPDYGHDCGPDCKCFDPQEKSLMTYSTRLERLVAYADRHKQQPIDLNYVAISKNDWEDIVGSVLSGGNREPNRDRCWRCKQEGCPGC